MRGIRALALVGIGAFTSACTTTGGPDPVLCGQLGLAAGAGGGAALAIGNKRGGELGVGLAGGTAGAAVGGVAGYFLCKLFEQEPPPPPPRAAPKPAPPPPPPPEPEVIPEPDPCAQVIRLRGVNFDFDRDEVRPDAAVILDEAVAVLGDLLASCPSKAVRIEGHTDWTGPEAYNQGLSERRARSVQRYLVKEGLDAAQLSTVGYGETHPMASNATREGRALNRRVDLRLVE